MDKFYPAGPVSVPPDLTQPTAAYRNHAWLAMGGLALFVVLYFALTGWFTWTAYRLLTDALDGGDVFWRFAAGVCAAFLAVFMWKALFFLQHRYQLDAIEVTAQEQPRLFEFLHNLADEAGAPRAHRVFLSPRVNAAVFYDLTVLNLLFPSKKNLEIGLGLVNALTLGELKAVLAHEFGHFAQRSMAVGRWVYIAQQIASQIISKRDVLDQFLRGLSRFDLRIAWVGWLLSLILWSIRSLMETVFRIVVLAQRALSREMELQADLVAVSLTGSDALIQALHRLQAADEAWDKALRFADSEARAGRAVTDLFEVQMRITDKLRAILDNPLYGSVTPPPQERPHEHRLFKTQLAQSPRMWSTHPANSEREHNAKRVYIPASIDERSAWDLFENVAGVKAQVSAHVFREAKTAPAALEESLKKLDEQYNRAYLDRSYRGAYLWRAIASHARQLSELYNPTLRAEFIAAELAALYPESLAADLQRLRDLDEERAMLQALHDGFLAAPNGVVNHRDRQLRRKDLPEAIEKVEAELVEARDKVRSHDRRCRTAHLAAAAGLGAGWDAYLQGLLHVVHYAEHNEANLHDARGLLANVYSIVTADGRVSSGERQRLLQACVEVHNALRHVYEDEGKSIFLDRTLIRRLEIESWQKLLGEFGLPSPALANLGEWLGVVDSWANAALAALSALRLAALEQMLLVESQVSRFVRDRMQPGPAPEASRIPANYPLMPPGNERPRQKKLDLWDRFHVADGLVPTLARLTVACGIVAAVLSIGNSVGQIGVKIYNGLGREVAVTIGSVSAQLAPNASATLGVPHSDVFVVAATTRDGKPIESFEPDIEHRGAHYVYNIAGASPLVQWTAVYGEGGERPRRMAEAPRWSTSDADFLFEEPPASISGDKYSSGGTREVLSAAGNEAPSTQLALLSSEAERNALIETHARWDDTNSRHVLYWLSMAAQLESFPAVLASRLALDPNDVATLRTEQDFASPQAHAQVCERHAALAEAAPANADLQYVAARCGGDEADRSQAFTDLHRRFPENAWLTQAVGYSLAEDARWQEALDTFGNVQRRLPPLAESIATDMARIRRVMTPDGVAGLNDLLPMSAELRYYMALEAGRDPGTQPYFHLANGEADRAVEALRKESDANPFLIRLAAASDRAGATLVREALRMPVDQGIDENTAWAAFALATREHADATPYLAFLRKRELATTDQILRFLESAQSGDTDEAERRLAGLDTHPRGHAYSIASVILGERAPAQWRVRASGLLFAAERPYFRLGTFNSDMAEVAPAPSRTLPRIKQATEL